MDQSEAKKREYVRRLLLSRMRILCANGFYGLLLMHMRYVLDEACETAATDGNAIIFSPSFLDELSDSELDFVMMHEILHVALKHCFRGKSYDQYLFNIACDIVVNSNILYSNGMKLDSISINGEPLMHITPRHDEGWLYTAEEVYDMLIGKGGGKFGNVAGGGSGDSFGRAQRRRAGALNPDYKPFDDHSRWGVSSSETEDLWAKYICDALEAVKNQCETLGRGTVPMFAKRLLDELKKPQIDWRTILNEFVQQEIVDYSFTPPDRRYEGDFFLPDFSDTEAVVRDILFMVDASGSMSDKMVAAAYSEVKGAIEQFGGKLKGWLGYFDAAVTAPVPFESVEDLIPPVGNGGTDFGVVFRYVKKYMQERAPACIVILTDGCAPIPQQSEANGIPVLWLLNNDKITPSWGKVARIKV